MNINDETFLKAYKCLSGANTLLKNGLGNFSELGKDALELISKSNVENGERLNKMNDDCVQIFDRMSLTIQLLSQINSKSAEYFNENLTDDDFGNFSSSSSSSSKAQYDSSIIYDEEFIKNLTEQINAALFAVDEDGKYPDYIMDGPNVLPNGQVAYHSIPDTLLLKLAKDGNKFYMNLKGKISSDSKVYVINDGAYSDHGDAFLDNLYKEYYSDVDNGIFIRMSSACGSPDSNSAVVETVCNMFDIPFNNTIIQGFSGGQATVMRVAADVCRKTGKPPAGVALVECHTKPDPWNQEDAKALHDANALVYAVYSNGDGNGSATKKEFTSWGQKYPGVKMVYIDRNRGGHENIYNDYLQSNMLSFFANSSDFPVENFAGSSIEIYNGTWVDYNISGKKNSEVVKELTNNDVFENEDNTVAKTETDNSTKDADSENIESDKSTEDTSSDKTGTDKSTEDGGTEEVGSDDSSVQSSGTYNGQILSTNPGVNYYTRTDGVKMKETYCDLNFGVSKELQDLFKYDGEKEINGVKIKDMKFWVREDGVQMLGDFACVATTVIPRSAYGIDDDMDATKKLWLGANCNYGDVVETSVGPGIVVGRCGEAYRLLNVDGIQNYDIYTYWNTGSYASKVRAKDYVPTNYAHDPKLENDGQAIIKAESTYEKNGILEEWRQYVNPLDSTQSNQTSISGTQKPTETVPPVQSVTQNPTETVPSVEPETQKPTETIPPVQYETQNPIETVPSVEPETQKPTQTIPPVQYEIQNPTETVPSVEPEAQKPTETIPPVQYETQNPTETVPSVEPEAQKPMETIPTVEYEIQKPMKTTPTVEPEIQESTESETFESINLNNIDVNSGENVFDGKKLVLPGILGAGLAFLGAKFGKIMKKKRKNDDI